MIVRCIAQKPTNEQAFRLGPLYEPGRTDYALALGNRYVALGLHCLSTGVIWVELASEGGWPQTVPLFLFEIVDPRTSRYWEGRFGADGSFSLAPPPFHESDFASLVADNEPQAELAYNRYRQLLEAEALEKADLHAH